MMRYRPEVRRPGLRRGGQRGAIGILAALLLFAALLALVLAVDTGRLFMEQRDLQRIADATALETAMAHTGCEAEADDAAATARDSAVRNGYAGDLTAEADAVLLGRLRVEDDGLRVFETGNDRNPEAVRILVRREVPTSLVLGGLFGGSTTLEAEAVAQRPSLVGISAGSWLAGLDSEQSVLLNALLNGLLDSELELGVVSWQGIAATSISLLELGEELGLLMVDAGVGTVDELLGTRVALADLLEATVTAVDRNAPLDVDVQLLRKQLLHAGLPEVEIALEEFLQVSAPGNREAALEAGVNAADLLLVSALTATGNSAIDLDLDLGLDSLVGELDLVELDVGVGLNVIEPPQIAIGPPGRDAEGEWHTRVETAQTRLQVDAFLELPGALATVDLGLALQLAQGEAWLEAVSCPLHGAGREVEVGTLPGLASLRLGRFSDIAASHSPDFEPGSVQLRVNLADVLDDLPLVGGALGGLLGGITDLDLLEVEVELGAEVPLEPASAETHFFELENRSDLPSAPVTSSTAIADAVDRLEIVLEDELELGLNAELLGLSLGLDLDAVVQGLLSDLVLPLLRPVLDALATQLLDPLLELLGLRIGGMEVQVVELREGGVHVVR